MPILRVGARCPNAPRPESIGKINGRMPNRPNLRKAGGGEKNSRMAKILRNHLNFMVEYASSRKRPRKNGNPIRCLRSKLRTTNRLKSPFGDSSAPSSALACSANCACDSPTKSPPLGASGNSSRRSSGISAICACRRCRAACIKIRRA